jgi:7-carboxy-7-deazaguanine synthase
MEVFGPTVQGEGPLAGAVTHFVRFGGCDYRCSWCDSMHAVDPALVRENAEHLTQEQILSRLLQLDGCPEWVTLSGGNPALMRLDGFPLYARQAGFKVAVETQGSMWRPWLGDVDQLVVSPKPPSSGMATARHAAAYQKFARAAEADMRARPALKIVVFDQADLDYARGVIADAPSWWPCYLSVGTDQPDPQVARLPEAHEDALRRISRRYRWLCEAVAADPTLGHVRVLPQLHVVAWGHLLGV